MEDKNTEQTGIDITRFMDALIRKAWLIAVVAAISSMLALAYTFIFVTPIYKASAVFYVSSVSEPSEGVAAGVSSGDISVARSLVKSCIVILETGGTLNDVIQYSGVNLDYDEIREMVTVGAIDNSEFFRVTVAGPNPAELKIIVDAIAYILPEHIAQTIEGVSTIMVDDAVVPEEPSFPDYKMCISKGFLLGAALAACVVVIQELKDNTIRSEEHLAENGVYPVLASIPDMNLQAKRADICSETAESYKMLRTKLQWLFAEEPNCQVLGVSSALSGEGKSTVSARLACAIAQLGMHVLIIDCDMRGSAMVGKLCGIQGPGLSEYLRGQSSGEKLIQIGRIQGEEGIFHIISCGDTPSNPSELLGSERMKKMLEKLRQKYDCIILDLPAVGKVGDALVVSKLIDGVLMVVRRNYCSSNALKSAIQQFEFVNTRIMGTVLNCADCRKYNHLHHQNYR